jgi:hypothetical protein
VTDAEARGLEGDNGRLATTVIIENIGAVLSSAESLAVTGMKDCRICRDDFNHAAVRVCSYIAADSVLFQCFWCCSRCRYTHSPLLPLTRTSPNPARGQIAEPLEVVVMSCRALVVLKRQPIAG